eukprot:7256662-Lingulodinium_polyedra.AAC.1
MGRPCLGPPRHYCAHLWNDGGCQDRRAPGTAPAAPAEHRHGQTPSMLLWAIGYDPVVEAAQSATYVDDLAGLA